MSDAINTKKEKLETTLRDMERVVIAYSGGVDSSFLTYFANTVLGKDNVLAVTASSETYTATEMEDARKFASKFNIHHKVIETREIQNKEFARNSKRRCYFCKQELFTKLNDIANEKGFKYVLDGANTDDIGDYRPGREAASELHVKSPLIDAGLSKFEIRKLSREIGLSTWNKPQMACLASRFPYGSRITVEGLFRVAAAESVIRDLGFIDVRVRDHGDIARIEVGQAELSKLLSLIAGDAIGRLKKLGYSYITIDAEGYRTGSMNEVLTN